MFACAAEWCPRDSDVWAYSPRAGGIVPSCVPHALDVTAGATKLKDNIPVRAREVCGR
jgi:hypothetical protein